MAKPGLILVTKGGYQLKIPFQTLKPTQETPINNTMTVKAFPLSHVNPFESTFFN
jgi:3',5'-cyclic-nucleotide phosphodiesterase